MTKQICAGLTAAAKAGAVATTVVIGAALLQRQPVGAVNSDAATCALAEFSRTAVGVVDEKRISSPSPIPPQELGAGIAAPQAAAENGFQAVSAPATALEDVPSPILNLRPFDASVREPRGLVPLTDAAPSWKRSLRLTGSQSGFTYVMTTQNGREYLAVRR